MLHTKGKWIAGIYMNEASVYCPSKKVGIAKLPYSSFTYSEEEVQANAKLIAAAPDLLEALQTCLVYLTMNSDMEEEHAEQIKLLEEAINKATA